MPCAADRPPGELTVHTTQTDAKGIAGGRPTAGSELANIGKHLGYRPLVYLTAALIGLVIIIMAWGLTRFVMDELMRVTAG